MEVIIVNRLSGRWFYLTLKAFFLFILAMMSVYSGVNAQNPGKMPDNPINLIRTGQDQKKALKVNDSIFQAIGFGNTFLVATAEGNVIIDTSYAMNAELHKKLLQAENSGPIKYIILTHGHGDHIGGIPAWKQPETRIIAQKNYVEFQNYQTRLAGFFAQRNAAQFALRPADPGPWKGNYAGKIDPTILFDDKYDFELGGVKFEIFHTPGETYDHLTVWVPKYKAAFVGDNYYDSFPNIYTLRGTKPRWALDYVESINKVLALKPEIILPSHGTPVFGSAEITGRLTKYRDAIQYVHDETVKGMNQGKDVWTLMNEIKLPPHLDIGDSYGRVSWTVRGIYEGYVGWFDLNPVTMYETPMESIYPDIVRLTGGPEKILALAKERLASGKTVEAMHLIDIVLKNDPVNFPALEVRLKALENLRDNCHNSNERGWLEFSINQVKSKLSTKK